MTTYKLTWIRLHSYKKPGTKKKLVKELHESALFISKEAALKSALSTPEESKCYDFCIDGVPVSAL